MDEKNKNEKTFSDLFSKVDNNKDEDNNSISFNTINEKSTEVDKDLSLEDIFEASKSQNEKKDNKDIIFSDIAFDSSKEDSISLEPINPQQSTEDKELKLNVNIFEQSKNDDIKESTSNSRKYSSNFSIFDTPNSVKKSEIKKEEQETENSNQADAIVLHNNDKHKIDIFDNKVEHANKKLDNDSNDIFKSNTKNDELSNPFFSQDVQNLQSNEQNLNEDKKTLDLDTDFGNPFFENNSNLIEDKFQDEEKKDNTFIDNQKKQSSSILGEEASPFFQEQSTSPFFSDMNQEDQLNPLFDNKINLIENENHNINNNVSNKIDVSNVKNFNVKIVKKKEPLIKFILGVISYAIFIWLLLIGITLLVYIADIKIRAAKGDTSPPKYNAYVVLTGSMLPEIQVYDVVITKKVDAKDLEKGDVITFASSDTRFLNTIITHRIIKKNYNAEKDTYTFQTKGDNNNVADSALVEANNIYGKVILKIPKLGYLQEFLATDGGWIIVILIPCLAVISYDIVRLIKGLKRKKYKNIKVQK